MQNTIYIYNPKLAEMVAAKILATQEYNNLYLMCKRIGSNERTWMHFKAHFQEEYIYREELEQTEGVAGYGSANKAKHSEMEYDFMNFMLEKESHHAVFT